MEVRDNKPHFSAVASFILVEEKAGYKLSCIFTKYYDLRISRDAWQGKLYGGTAKWLEEQGRWETPAETALREALEEPRVKYLEGDLAEVVWFQAAKNHTHHYFAGLHCLAPEMRAYSDDDPDEFLEFSVQTLEFVVENLVLRHLKGFRHCLGWLIDKLAEDARVSADEKKARLVIEVIRLYGRIDLRIEELEIRRRQERHSR